MLIFSVQSVIKDPPFSKIDIVSCRNLLIYLKPVLQKKIIPPLFHYSLKANGYLVLGTAESISGYADLFQEHVSKVNIYQQQPQKSKYRWQHNSVTSMTKGNILSMKSKSHDTVFDHSKDSLQKITEHYILKESKLVGILVDSIGNILYLHGNSGQYFEMAQGLTGPNNILNMARPGLIKDLKKTLLKVVESEVIVRTDNIDVRGGVGENTKVDVVVYPVTYSLKADEKLFAVVISESNHNIIETNVSGQDNQQLSSEALPQGIFDELKLELRIKEDHLTSVNETLEVTNYELRLSNEELQSVNEELQSTNEELETSKEELQSINEELTTVNSELEVKVNELTQANNDINNLLSATNIETIFIDFDQRILRYTLSSSNIVNLIETDIGRPITDISFAVHNYLGLKEDIDKVLDTLIPIKVQVGSKNNVWHEMIIQPYRTIDNIIEGVVITFVDITRMKKNMNNV